MRRVHLLCVAVALAGLGGCRTAPVSQPGGPPLAKAPDVPENANFVLSVSEAVATLEEDQSAFVKIFIDGKEAGQTATDSKSKPRKWGEALAVGNHLFRFEGWALALPGGWAPLREDWQPPERFIRVESGARTVVTLKFYDSGRHHTLDVSRAPLAELP